MHINTKDLLPLNLALFDGEGSGAGAAPAGTGITTNSAASADQGTGDTGSGGVQTTSSTLEERRKAYRDFIQSEEYRDIHTQETQRVIDRRFREAQANQKALDGQKPIIDLLAQRYGVKDGDMGKLLSAIESDSAYWEEAAEAAGMTVDQYMQVEKLKRENAALLEAQRRQLGEQETKRQVEAWYTQAEATKAKYPGFDLQTEMQNRDFVGLLKNGISVEHAYKLLHMDELMNNAVMTTAVQTEQKVVNNIRAKGNRPLENGAASKSGFTVSKGVHGLSSKERAELLRRSAHGERITFT